MTKPAGTLSPRDDSGSLYRIFKARSPVTENLRFEKKRVPLFDAKCSTKTGDNSKKTTPFSRDNFV